VKVEGGNDASDGEESDVSLADDEGDAVAPAKVRPGQYP